VAGWIAIAFGVHSMALRILILACSLTVSAARLSQRDAVPVGELHFRPGKSSAVNPAYGHFYPLVGREELLCSPRSLADGDEDEGGYGANPHAFAVQQVAGIDPAISPSFPTHSCPRAARFSSWRPPLCC
jgi:hypothetical protein